MENTAVRLEYAEEDALNQMVKAGLFSNKDEAARAAIVKYASDLGILNPSIPWENISSHKKRSVTPEQLKKDLETLEDEI